MTELGVKAGLQRHPTYHSRKFAKRNMNYYYLAEINQ